MKKNMLMKEINDNELGMVTGGEYYQANIDDICFEEYMPDVMVVELPAIWETI